MVQQKPNKSSSPDSTLGPKESLWDWGRSCGEGKITANAPEDSRATFLLFFGIKAECCFDIKAEAVDFKPEDDTFTDILSRFSEEPATEEVFTAAPWPNF